MASEQFRKRWGLVDASKSRTTPGSKLCPVCGLPNPGGRPHYYHRDRERQQERKNATRSKT